MGNLEHSLNRLAAIKAGHGCRVPTKKSFWSVDMVSVDKKALPRLHNQSSNNFNSSELKELARDRSLYREIKEDAREAKVGVKNNL